MGGRRGRGTKGRSSGRGADGTVARLQVALLVAVLLTAGILIGSFLIEWRHTRLIAPEPESTFAGMPRGVGEDSLPRRIRVEVLNGAGVPGAARTVAERLRSMGFDVVYAGNASSFDVETSLMFDRSGRPGAARAVADSAGIDSLVSRLSPELHLDATVLLGADWESLFVRSAAGDSAEAGPGFLERLRQRLRD